MKKFIDLFRLFRINECVLVFYDNGHVAIYKKLTPQNPAIGHIDHMFFNNGFEIKYFSKKDIFSIK